MKFIKSSFEILEPTGYTIDDIYKSIELAGRTCYLSYDKITDNSAKKFISMIYNRGHFSVYEQGTIYLCTPINYTRLDNNKYTVINIFNNKKYITTNFRVLTERSYNGILTFLCKPTEYHEKRISVKFILPISISREFLRHKLFCVAK